MLIQIVSLLQIAKQYFRLKRISILDAVLCIPKATKVELGEILIS